MLLRSRISPNNLLRIAMAALVVALLANRFIRPHGWLTEDLADGVRGFLFGIAITLQLFYVIRYRRDSRCA